jgi:amino acid transporter
MEPGEALGIAAQIAVTLAGFAGVVVVFRRESLHEWSPADKLRLRLLLTNSILPLVFCMIGILLLTIRPLPTGIWRWCSGFALVVSLLFAIPMTKLFRRLNLRQIQSGTLHDLFFICSEPWA